jgi:hypothetical protein
MGKTFPIPALLLFSPLLLGLGCNNFEIPLRENRENTQPADELRIHIDRSLILDTEPLPLYAEGARGVVTWRADPALECRFEPGSGDRVLFFPPDLAGERVFRVIAEDEAKNSASVSITVVDEGQPPGPSDLLINEIAWAGTLTSAYDEYVELVNTTERPFYLHNWYIDNAAGKDIPILFSGRIEGQSCFVIANYGEGSEKSALECAVQFSDASISLSNSAFGPFALRNGEGALMDSVGDGGDHRLGINTPETRSSLSRYSWARSTRWTPEHWYTEGVSINLCDGTLGTPGAANSDVPFGGGSPVENAEAVLTEYAVDPDDDIGEDWAEVFIVKSGSMKNFVLTDLDGEDSPITRGVDMPVMKGEYYLVVWHTYEEGYDFETRGYLMEGNRIHIPDNPPTGTKDQIVLTCEGIFMDGLCYYTEGSDPFDNDESKMRGYGWEGEPILGKHAARALHGEGGYAPELSAACWDRTARSTPGAPND